MSRRLVQGGQRASTGTPDRRRKATEPPQSTALPPYEQPRYPMSEANRMKLSTLVTTSHDYAKYKEAVRFAIRTVTNCTGDGYEQVAVAREDAAKLAKRRERAQQEGGEEVARSEAEEQAEARAAELQDTIDRLAKDAEKALRDLIDYGDELTQQSNILKAIQDEVAINAANAPDINRPRPIKRRRVEQEDDSEDDANMQVDEPEEVPYDALSAAELLQKANAEYAADYTSQSLRRRYAEHNDYIGFKRTIHDVQNPGQNAPPLPHSSTWFPQDERADAPNTTTSRATAEDSTQVQALSDDDDDDDNDNDDDIEIAGEIQSLNCPLTLKLYTEPYSNKVCSHTFEKYAIIEYFNDNAVAPMGPAQGRRRQQPVGAKRIRCPVPGCESYLQLDDFYDDQFMLRKVRRLDSANMANEEDSRMQDDGDDSDPDGYGAIDD